MDRLMWKQEKRKGSDWDCQFNFTLTTFTHTFLGASIPQSSFQESIEESDQLLLVRNVGLDVNARGEESSS